MFSADDLPSPLVEVDEEAPEVLNFTEDACVYRLPPQGIDLKSHLADIEREMITRALRNAGGVVLQAAEALGMGRTTLVEKIRRYKIPRLEPAISAAGADVRSEGNSRHP